jgi:MFS family permease
LFGGIVPISFTSVITRITPRERYTTAMGVYNSSGDLGFFVGPLIGGAAALFGITAPFFLCAPLGAAVGKTGERRSIRSMRPWTRSPGSIVPLAMASPSPSGRE